MDTCA